MTTLMVMICLILYSIDVAANDVDNGYGDGVFPVGF